MSTGRMTWVAVAVAVLAAACGGTDSGSSARLSVDGRATVASVGGPARVVQGNRTLRAGDVVKVESGTAQIRLSGDRRLELRPLSELGLVADPGSADLRPSLRAGDLLVLAGGGKVTVAAGDGDVSVSGGTAKLSRGLAVTAASYTAIVTAESAGRTLEVLPLRQVSLVASGVLPGRPNPLAYDNKDEWDRRFLADAIDLGRQLVARSRGFTAQLGPTEGRTPGFYRQLLPALEKEPSFDMPLLGTDRAPGEALVGLAIAVQSTRGPFADRLRAALAFHDDGAAWGLVALDQGVTQAPLLARVDEAIGRQPAVSAALAPKAAPPTTRGSSTTPTTGRPSTGGTVSAPPRAAPPPAATPTTRGPLNTGLPIDDTVNAILDLLSGVLGSLGKSPR